MKLLIDFLWTLFFQKLHSIDLNNIQIDSRKKQHRSILLAFCFIIFELSFELHILYIFIYIINLFIFNLFKIF